VEKLAETGKTDHPLLMAIFSSRFINEVSGGTVVKPWEIDEDPEFYNDWIEAALALKDMTNIYQRKQRREAAIEAEFKKMEDSHKFYKAYRH
jgi:hypothetical protein